MMRSPMWTAGVAMVVVACALGASAQGSQAALDAIKGYEFGQSRKPLDAVAALVVAAVDTPQQQTLANELVSILKGNATLECKRFVCRQLAVVGTEEQVDAVAPFLLDKDLSDMARYALQPIAGAEVDAALLDALKSADGSKAIQIGLVESLGARGTARAVSPLRKLILAGDEDVARAAIVSLGRIGTSRAGRALASAKGKVAPALKDDVSQAQLIIAGNCLASGKRDRAGDMYEALVTPEESDAVRKAAFIGLARSGGLNEDNDAWRARLDRDPALREAAAGYLHGVADRYDTLAEQQTAR